MTEYFSCGEINERSFSNPHPSSFRPYLSNYIRNQPTLFSIRDQDL